MEKKVSRNEMGHLLPVKCSSMEFDRRTHALRRILESWICVHHFGSSVGIIGAVEWYSLLCFLWPQLLEYCLFYRVRNGVPTFVITRFFRWSDEDSSFYLVICSAEVLSSRRGFFFIVFYAFAVAMLEHGRCTLSLLSVVSASIGRGENGVGFSALSWPVVASRS